MMTEVSWSGKRVLTVNLVLTPTRGIGTRPDVNVSLTPVIPISGTVATRVLFAFVGKGSC